MTIYEDVSFFDPIWDAPLFLYPGNAVPELKERIYDLLFFYRHYLLRLSLTSRVAAETPQAADYFESTLDILTRRLKERNPMFSLDPADHELNVRRFLCLSYPRLLIFFPFLQI